MQTFLLRNPDVKVAGLIYGAPFFEFAEHNNINIFRRILAMTISAIGEEIILNPIMQA